jgi:hypothetical protein
VPGAKRTAQPPSPPRPRPVGSTARVRVGVAWVGEFVVYRTVHTCACMCGRRARPGLARLLARSDLYSPDADVPTGTGVPYSSSSCSRLLAARRWPVVSRFGHSTHAAAHAPFPFPFPFPLGEREPVTERHVAGRSRVRNIICCHVRPRWSSISRHQRRCSD